MLRAGAADVFFAKVGDGSLLKAFNRIMKYIPEGSPVICESPALRFHVEPGLFILMTSDNEYNRKDISDLLSLSHVKISLRDLHSGKSMPVTFMNGRWSGKF